ncbi:hypothetical protein M5K25_000332 [Dendrobium thyrsiflorum]|uniref:Terpene synthase N-terminal domain-containing protein n=1 Tax=Dendrobium thyrsiflorum TaxID=117978 RepID=A0ABD0VTK8_DENTH
MEDGIVRHSAGYSPSVWGDYFIKNHAPFSSTTQKTEEWMRERVGELVTKVKNLLDNTYEDELQSLELIDSLQRLGVGYHFEEEIDKRLREIHDHNGKIEGNDLQAVALKFRLLRQHGYNVTSDVFSKYKDDEGKFKSNLANNVRGLLSLYEACFLSTHEDDILDEALKFTKHHLQSLSEVDQVDPTLKSLISLALELPFHRKIPRLGARYYMRGYEQDKENRNDVVLELSKLDFNLLQLLHYEEARRLSMSSSSN